MDLCFLTHYNLMPSVLYTVNATVSSFIVSVWIVCISYSVKLYTQFSLHQVHVTYKQFRCFMAIGSLPQTLLFLVVTGDQVLADNGLFLVISDACLNILLLKRVSLSASYL